MNSGRSKVKLPQSYWIRNGKLADQIMLLILKNMNEQPETTIESIRGLALKHKQEVMGEPTFAKAVVELIEKIKTDHKTKINLIVDAAKVTINLRNLKTGQVH